METSGHWILIIKPEPGTIEVFDSLGADRDNLIQRLSKLGNKIIFNESRVQATGTKTCGLFCLYVAFWRLCDLDLSFEEVMKNIFFSDMIKNEALVEEFSQTYLI